MSKIGAPTKYNSEIFFDYILEHNAIPQFSTSQYLTTRDNLPFICNNHIEKGVQYKKYSDMIKRQNQKYICKYCLAKERIDNRKYSYEQVKDLFLNKNSILITENYINAKTKMDFICCFHEEYGIQKTTVEYLMQNKNICKQCQSESKRGENHYNWQGGITPIRQKDNHDPIYLHWISEVFKRDNYTCQCCGKTKTKLNAHHLYSFCNYIFNRKTVSNGITLCEHCHATNIENSFHNLYGTKNFYPEDLYEYIQRHQSGEFNKLE